MEEIPKNPSGKVRSLVRNLGGVAAPDSVLEQILRRLLPTLELSSTGSVIKHTAKL